MASKAPPPTAPPTAPLGSAPDPFWPVGYVTKVVGDASTQAGQIVVINGVEHRVDAFGRFDPPLSYALDAMQGDARMDCAVNYTVDSEAT